MNETFVIEDGKLIMKPAEGETVKLEQRAGALEGLTKFEVMGIPIGQAAGGLLVVSVWDAIRGLLGGILPAQIPQWLIPVIGAWVVNTKTMRGFLGNTAANAAGLILIADSVQALFNVRGLVSGLVGGVKLGQIKTGGNGHREITSLAQYNQVHGLA